MKKRKVKRFYLLSAEGAGYTNDPRLVDKLVANGLFRLCTHQEYLARTAKIAREETIAIRRQALEERRIRAE